MRVVYICADRGIPVFGSKGASVHVQEIIRAFRRRGDEVDLIAARLGGDPPPDLADLRVKRLRGSRSADGITRGKLAPGEIDAVLEKALPKADRGWSLVYERHALWSSAGMRFARQHDIPGVLEVNAPLVREQARHRRLENPAYAQRLAAESLRAATLRVAVSSGVAAAHDEYGLGLHDFLVCPNGVNPNRFPERAPGAPRTDFTIGFLGTLKPWHGLPVLIEAFALLAPENPNLRLLIAGDGPMREEMEQQLQAVGLSDRSRFLGALHPAAVPEALGRMDVGVAPYDEADGHYFSPLKIFEYMAASKPVVASSVGQIPQLITEGEEGLLVEAGDVTGLAEALRKLSSSPEIASRMGEAGRRRVLAHHTWDAVLERVLAALPQETRSSCSHGGNAAAAGAGRRGRR